MHVSPFTASLYGGGYSGDITYDANGVVPNLRLDQQVTGVDMAPFLTSSQGANLTQLTLAGMPVEISGTTYRPL